MNAAELYIDAMGRADGTLRKALDGLSLDEIRSQPAGAGSNPIGWLVWHLSRGRASIAAGITGTDSVWESGGWAARFGMEGEVPRFEPANVHTFDPKSPETLVGFFSEATEKVYDAVRGLSDSDLEREVTTRAGRPPAPISSRLSISLFDNIQHIGQVAYLRGLIREQGWF